MTIRHPRALSLAIALAAMACLAIAREPAERSLAAPRGQTVSVKMIGPVTQGTDLQVLCILRHVPSGDRYAEAMDDLNAKLGGLLATLRDRGEFDGDLGETLVFTPPAGSIAPREVLLIGVGPEEGLTLDRLRLAGRIAAREAARLHAAHVSFAPALRDQGSSRIDVGDGDAAVAEDWLLACDTEHRLRQQGLSQSAEVSSLTIEAGARYFDGASDKVAAAVKRAAEQIQQRSAAPYIPAR